MIDPTSIQLPNSGISIDSTDNITSVMLSWLVDNALTINLERPNMIDGMRRFIFNQYIVEGPYNSIDAPRSILDVSTKIRRYTTHILHCRSVIHSTGFYYCSYGTLYKYGDTVGFSLRRSGDSVHRIVNKEKSGTLTLRSILDNEDAVYIMTSYSALYESLIYDMVTLYIMGISIGLDNIVFKDRDIFILLSTNGHLSFRLDPSNDLTKDPREFYLGEFVSSNHQQILNATLYKDVTRVYDMVVNHPLNQDIAYKDRIGIALYMMALDTSVIVPDAYGLAERLASLLPVSESYEEHPPTNISLFNVSMSMRFLPRELEQKVINKYDPDVDYTYTTITPSMSISPRRLPTIDLVDADIIVSPYLSAIVDKSVFEVGPVGGMELINQRILKDGMLAISKSSTTYSSGNNSLGTQDNTAASIFTVSNMEIVVLTSIITGNVDVGLMAVTEIWRMVELGATKIIGNLFNSLTSYIIRFVGPSQDINICNYISSVVARLNDWYKLLYKHKSRIWYYIQLNQVLSIVSDLCSITKTIIYPSIIKYYSLAVKEGASDIITIYPVDTILQYPDWKDLEHTIRTHYFIESDDPLIYQYGTAFALLLLHKDMYCIYYLIKYLGNDKILGPRRKKISKIAILLNIIADITKFNLSAWWTAYRRTTDNNIIIYVAVCYVLDFCLGDITDLSLGSQFDAQTFISGSYLFKFDPQYLNSRRLPNNIRDEPITNEIAIVCMQRWVSELL